jgi:hypothetical protein
MSPLHERLNAVLIEVGEGIGAALRHERVDVAGLRARIVHAQDQIQALADEMVEEARQRARDVRLLSEVCLDGCLTAVAALEADKPGGAVKALELTMTALGGTR